MNDHQSIQYIRSDVLKVEEVELMEVVEIVSAYVVLERRTLLRLHIHHINFPITYTDRTPIPARCALIIDRLCTATKSLRISRIEPLVLHGSFRK